MKYNASVIDYVLQVSCACDERVFIHAFKLLNDVLHNKMPDSINHENYPSLKLFSANSIKKLSEDTCLISNSPSEIAHYINNNKIIDRTAFYITISVQDDTDQDIFSYRYFFLIVNQLLREQDKVYFDCPETYYHKIASYFFLQAVSFDKKLFMLSQGGNKVKKLPRRFTLSTEWLPSIYLSKKNSELYDVLANPLFEDIEELTSLLKLQKAIKLDFNSNIYSQKASKRELYRVCLKSYFANWLNGMLSECYYVERIYSMPGIAQLLFAILCVNYGKDGLYNIEKLEKLLDVCFDFSDCILQIAENILSHTEGGVLSIRINNNWDKIDNVFQPNNLSLRQSWYMRISLVDYSQHSILDNIKCKSNIDALTLPHVFMEQKAPGDMGLAQYQEIAKSYQIHLNDSEHIIHHYGLAVFRNIVNQYGGCFTVKSDVKHTEHDIAEYILDSSKISYIHGNETIHIPGTEYDILLPLDEQLLNQTFSQNIPSVLLKPKYIVPSISKNIVFEEAIYNHFNEPLSRLIRHTMRSTNLEHQELKEQVVEVSAKELAQKLSVAAVGPISENVYYFYLSDVTEQIFGRAEIVAKIILKTIAELKKNSTIQGCETEELYLVLYGLTESKLALFTRQYALFYHRHEGNRLMKGCRIFVVSRNYQSEVMFAGVKLSIISEYSKSRRLVTGTSAKITDILTHIASRDSTPENIEDINELQPVPFELMKRMELVDGNITLSSHNRWYHHNLETVLNNDIHGKDLGCCINDIHVRSGKIHLHTFFEVQLLFGNMYWYQIFAHYICESILADKNINKKMSILLYGYETYSEQTLFAATEKLKSHGYDVHFAVFENPKYITSAETSEQRIRYIEEFFANDLNNICISYIFGIGTTLSTISERMNAELKRSFYSNRKDELLEKAYQKGIVIVQISDGKDNRIVTCDRNNHTVVSKMAELNFLPNKSCQYMIEVASEWHLAKECKYCLCADSYYDELPLIQTNETSTVPMILIKPTGRAGTNIKLKQQGIYSQIFFDDAHSDEYLYYSHLNRAGNHYQYYIRTAALLNDYLKRNDQSLSAWFKEIKMREVNEETHNSITRISFIVSPLHFSSESLAAAVNDRVFGGEAYIINFDVKKEFRDSFIAKYQNYYSALEMLKQNALYDKEHPLELNFYFVDDIILTGSTFSRAKSLVSSMLGEFLRDRGNYGISINLFKGIILLVNRNSKETLQNYFTPELLDHDEDGNTLLPVYSFIELNTPAIRSYGDSCPICNKLERIRNLEKESSLTYVEHHWKEKEKYHGLKKLSDAKNDKMRKNTQHIQDIFYKTRGLRRLQCSEIIWQIIKKNDLTIGNAKEILEQEIASYLDRLGQPDEKIEYLISFIKIISREHVVFQEMVQPAALKILLSIFSIYIKDNVVSVENGFYKTVYTLIDNCSQGLSYALYQLVIARLCAMGSTVLCRKEQLIACLNVGLMLEKKISIPERTVNGSFSSFLCIQLKKMLFATQDCSLRVKELQGVLKECIDNEIIKENRENGQA